VSTQRVHPANPPLPLIPRSTTTLDTPEVVGGVPVPCTDESKRLLLGLVGLQWLTLQGATQVVKQGSALKQHTNMCVAATLHYNLDG
jgi:hypothetical protein